MTDAERSLLGRPTSPGSDVVGWYIISPYPHANPGCHIFHGCMDGWIQSAYVRHVFAMSSFTFQAANLNNPGHHQSASFASSSPWNSFMEHIWYLSCQCHDACSIDGYVCTWLGLQDSSNSVEYISIICKVKRYAWYVIYIYGYTSVKVL